jgi:integrase
MRKGATLRRVTDNTPTTVFGSTPRKATKHRKFMVEAEVHALAKAADSHRDRTMILVAFRHGLRVSELVNLRWDQIDLQAAIMRVWRQKKGRDATHPIIGAEIRELRRLKREQPPGTEFVFMSRLGGPMTARAFGLMLHKVSLAAGLHRVNPHALRHAAGYKLAGEGRNMRDVQHYLGRRGLAATEIYTEAAPTNFKGWFK